MKPGGALVASFHGGRVHRDAALCPPERGEFLFAWLKEPPGPRRLEALEERFGWSHFIGRRLTERPPSPGVRVSARAVVTTLTALEGKAQNLKEHPLTFLLGPRLLLVTSYGEDALVAPVWDELEDLVPLGTDTVLFSLLEPLVAGYESAASLLAERAGTIEELVLKRAPHLYEDIHRVRHEARHLERLLEPQVDALDLLKYHHFEGTVSEDEPYLSELARRAQRIMGELDRTTASATGAVESYASVVSNSMNRVMKFLTILSTVFLPGTFIASIFGMNFKIPELNWPFGYWWALALMVVIGLSFFFYMDVKGWFVA